MSEYVCEACGFLGQPDRELRGSGALELILLLCGIVPGVVYGIWRHRGPVHLCPRCQQEVIATESPAGMARLAARPQLPRPGLSRLERISRSVKAIPVAGGVGVVCLMAASLVFPSVRDEPWFTWLVYAAAAAILAHPVWLVIHVLFKAFERN